MGKGYNNNHNFSFSHIDLEVIYKFWIWSKPNFSGRLYFRTVNSTKVIKWNNHTLTASIFIDSYKSRIIGFRDYYTNRIIAFFYWWSVSINRHIHRNKKGNTRYNFFPYNLIIITAMSGPLYILLHVLWKYRGRDSSC